MATGTEPRRALARMALGRGHAPRPVELQTLATWEDTAMALAWLRRPGEYRDQETGLRRKLPDRCAQYLLRYLWCGEGHVIGSLHNWLLQEVADLAVRHKWPPPKPGNLTRLVVTAMREKVSRRPCTTCAASGWVWYPAIKRDKPCTVCQGRGYFPWSQRERADAMGIALSTYQEVWQDRYLAVLDHIDWRERRSLTVIRRMLRGA